MAAGFRSLFAPWVGGASGVTPVSTGSVRSMLAPWIGGAASPPVVVQGGTRSMLAPWIGGASAPPIIIQGGVRSLLAPWMGGASTIPGVIPPTPPAGKKVNLSYRPRLPDDYYHDKRPPLVDIPEEFDWRRRAMADEDDIVLSIVLALAAKGRLQ